MAMLRANLAVVIESVFPREGEFSTLLPQM